MKKALPLIVTILAFCGIIVFFALPSLFMTSCSSPEAASGPIDKAVANIKWIDTGSQFGSDCIMATLSGKVVYFDPVDIELREGKTWPKADLIFYTHGHSDHYSAATALALSKDDTVVIASGEIAYQIQDAGVKTVLTAVPPGSETEGLAAGSFKGSDGKSEIKFRTVPMYGLPDGTGHAKVMEWVGYVVEADGVTIWFAGSSGLNEDVKALKGIDIALESVTNGGTMTVAEAADFAKIVQPKVLVPIHWNDDYKAEVAKLSGMMPEGTKCVILPLD